MSENPVIKSKFKQDGGIEANCAKPLTIAVKTKFNRSLAFAAKTIGSDWTVCATSACWLNRDERRGLSSLVA